MKHKLLLMLLFSIWSSRSYSQDSRSYTWRNDKKNEIQFMVKGMWAVEFFSYGLSYERTFYKLKNNRAKSYLSWKTDVLNRFDIFDRTFDISSTNNQLQTFIKYNYGYKNIFSGGLGVILVGERFYMNPTFTLSYKHDIRKKRVVIGFDYQASLSGRVPPTKPSAPVISSVFPTSPKSILHNFCVGVFVGKYF